MVMLLSSRPDHLLGWNYNGLTRLDFFFFQAITWAKDWNIFKYTSKNTVVISLTLGNKTATFTAIPLEFYEKIEIYTFQFWKNFSISDTCYLLYYVISLVKHDTEADQA